MKNCMKLKFDKKSGGLMNKFKIFDIVKIKNETDTYKIYAMQYFHNKGIIYELWRIGDSEEFEVQEDRLELVKAQS